MIYTLQVLRFLAAFFVVLTHSMGEQGFEIQVGAFGVDLFFVISGFIIAHVTEGDQKNFLEKRIIRIVPLYWLFTLLLTGVTLVAPSLLNAAEFNIPHIISSLFFYPYWTAQTDFKPILKLGWTLNYEMFFYALFFIAMKVSHTHREFLASLLIIVVLTGVAIFPPADTSPLAFYGGNIMFEFVFGMVLAKLYRGGLCWRIRLTTSAGISILALSSMILLTYWSDRLDRVIVFGVPSAILLYVAFCVEPWFVQRSNRIKEVAVRLGDLSYPMYLIHIYVIASLSRLFEIEISIGMLFTMVLVFTLLVAWAVDIYYDRPMRSVLRRKFLVRQRQGVLRG
ncbi:MULTISPECIES: acyltransferase family protein [Salipiger]|uniref:Putative acyltransferase n=1 Tax=Salipiger profundus TaxID=1229727 RepID=A0A1U7DDQ5_9RHOB|nr:MULTISPECIES: acyltransferase [Salipiger]APX26242.1 putative acyltransferase [Salipiger profundus]